MTFTAVGLRRLVGIVSMGVVVSFLVYGVVYYRIVAQFAENIIEASRAQKILQTLDHMHALKG